MAEVSQQSTIKIKQLGKRIGKIPREFLWSPGGFVVILLALFFEIVDLILPGGSLTFEIVPDLIIALLLVSLAGVPLSSTILPFLIERIPVLSDILPTWLVKIFFF